MKTDADVSETRPKAGALTDDELAVILSEMNKQSLGHLSDEVNSDIDQNLERYLGKPFGNEEDGLSQAMTMDSAEVVDWALPDLLEPFVSGDKAVEFEANRQQDEDWVENATERANHTFWCENDGFTFLHDIVKTALIQKVGYSKTWWKETTKEVEENLGGLSILQLLELGADASLRIVDVQASPINAAELPEDAAAAFEDGKVYDVRIVRTEKAGFPCLEVVPPEKMKVSKRAVNIAAVDYIAHEEEVPKWQLVEMGFDHDTVSALASEKTSDAEADVRFADQSRPNVTAHMIMQQTVLLVDEYPMLDIEGTGKTERWQVLRVGNTILSKQRVSEHPFDACPADRIPSRLIGLSLVDKVKELHRTKTDLLRDTLNSVYMAVRPRIEVPMESATDDTLDDLLKVRIGGLIRTKGKERLSPIVTPDLSGSAMGVITYLDGMREQQSGVTRNGMSVSSEMIDPKSATESNRQSRNEQVRKRLMCRMIAEVFLVPVFRKILRLLVAYQDTEKAIKVAGKWVPMSPKSWNANALARVAVGLGHANREEELASAQVVLAHMAMGREMGLVQPVHFYHAAKRLIRAVGWRNIDEYMLNPETPEGQQIMQQMQEAAAQNPEMMEAQGKLAIEQQKLQQGSQVEAAKLQQKSQADAMKAELQRMTDQMKAQNELHLRQMQLSAETQLQIMQQNMEAQLTRYEIDRNAEVKHEAEKTKAKLSSVRMGGKVG